MFNVFSCAILFRIEFDLRQKIFQWYCLSNFHASQHPPETKNVQFIAGFNSIVCHETRSTFFRSRLWTLVRRVNGCVCDFIRLLVCIFVRISICHHDFQLQIQMAYNAAHISLALGRSTFSIVLHIDDITSLCIGRKKRHIFMMEKKLWFRLDLVHLNTINIVVVVLRSQKRKRGTKKMCLICNRHDTEAEATSPKNMRRKLQRNEKHAQPPASQPSTFYTYYIVITPNGFLFWNTPISLIHCKAIDWTRVTLYVSAMYVIRWYKSTQHHIHRPQIFIFFSVRCVNHTHSMCNVHSWNRTDRHI